MSQLCPYCGKDCTALKNHVRLSSNNGHGRYGDYPDDFLEESEEPLDSEIEDKDNDSVEEAQPISIENTEESYDTEGGRTVDLTSSELDYLLSTVEDEAYERGRKQGFDQDSNKNEHFVDPEIKPEETDIDIRESSESLPSEVGMIVLGGLIAVVIGAMKGISNNQQNDDQVSTVGYPPEV